MSSHLRLRARLLPFLTVLLIAAEVLNPSAVWRGLLAAFGGAWLISYVWALSLQRSLYLERLMRFDWVQVGDQLEEKFKLVNASVVPATWVAVLDRSTLPGYIVSRATGVEGNSNTSWYTTGICSRRGTYRLGGTVLQTGDPLGIYSAEIIQPESKTLTVMPPIIPLPEIQVRPGGWLGDGRPRPHAPEEMVVPATVRPYVQGDSQRLIHWPTSARQNELYVRLMEGAPLGDWWIALDFDQSVQIARDEWLATTELGTILAASLADRGLRARRSVGLLASGTVPIWLRPQAGENRRWEILRALASLEPGEMSLAGLLESAGSGLGRQASLIVITSSTKSDWLQPLTHLAWRGITPTVILMEPASFGSSKSTRSLEELLKDTGIAYHIMTSDLLKHPQAHPGSGGQWEWRVMPTGKAIPVHTPGDLTWRKMA